MTSVFWASQLIKILSLWVIQCGTGHLALRKGIKVNYTRKINHFFIFFLPLYLDKLLVYEQSLKLFTIGCFISVSSLIIYIGPIRESIPIVGKMFASFDRPEDRPHTLMWLTTQIAAGYLVIILMIMLYIQKGHTNLILIPVLINGIGDGLAEPVGVRFGKLKYRTHALFSKKKYVRTVEGSACVFITSIIVIMLYKSCFTQGEYIAAVIIVPILMTLAEAFAPHTWDTPFLFLTGYLLLYLIKTMPL